jgi:hypothetical protein
MSKKGQKYIKDPNVIEKIKTELTQRKELVDELNDFSYEKIGKRYGISGNAVWNIAKRFGLQCSIGRT